MHGLFVNGKAVPLHLLSLMATELGIEIVCCRV